jgi:hypothetical protein
MDHLQTRLDALEHHVQTLHQQTRTVTRRLRWWRGLACGLLGLAVLTWGLPLSTAQEDTVAGGEKEKKGLAQRVAALETLLKHFSREGNEVVITGANLHIVNGLGSTDCLDDQDNEIPDCPNGLGNLIVGYNELRGGDEDVRTGSHNVVVGRFNNFSRVGGLVVGDANTISGPFAVVSGGELNTASGFAAAVSGGTFNTASGEFSSVSGGIFNTASEASSSVSGGSGNTASGPFASVSGGGFDVFFGEEGAGNTASGEVSSVSGGSGNIASGSFAAVSGGRNRTAEGEFDWVAGSLVEDD